MIELAFLLIAIGLGTFAIYSLVKAVDPKSSSLLCLIPFVNLYPAARKLAGSSFWPAIYVASSPLLFVLYFGLPYFHASTAAAPSPEGPLAQFFATLFGFGFMIVKMILGILALYVVIVTIAMLIQAARTILTSRLHQVGVVVAGVLLTPYLGFFYIYLAAYKIKLNPPQSSGAQYTVIESLHPQNWTVAGYVWATLGAFGALFGFLLPPLIMFGIPLILFAPIITYFQHYPNMVDRTFAQGLVCILSLIITIPFAALLASVAVGFSESQTAKTQTEKNESVAHHMSTTMSEKMSNEQGGDRKNKTQEQPEAGFEERFSYSDISFASNRQGNLRIRGKIHNKTPIMYTKPTFELTVYNANDRPLLTKTLKPGKITPNDTRSFEVWLKDVKPDQVARYSFTVRQKP